MPDAPYMKNKTLDVTINEFVATIALNRPEVHNAMNDTLIGELTSCIKNLGDDSTIRVIIITGKDTSRFAKANEQFDIFGLIQKPIELAKLSRWVSSALTHNLKIRAKK